MEKLTVKELAQILNEYVKQGLGDYEVVASRGSNKPETIDDIEIKPYHKEVKLNIY